MEKMKKIKEGFYLGLGIMTAAILVSIIGQLFKYTIIAILL